MVSLYCYASIRADFDLAVGRNSGYGDPDVYTVLWGLAVGFGVVAVISGVIGLLRAQEGSRVLASFVLVVGLVSVGLTLGLLA